ncbi:hypothetical protein ACFP2T_11130 [Plantactinospora solaniradicis]|uniref:Peptidase C39-like domain-containing protein n=1 Tax=Plantactinospora solaniradicis TaxID=1723736 RepID=A0ABW1K5M4_9ACTN
MTSTDYAQLSTLINRLRQLLSAVNPANAVSTVSTVLGMISEPPPGDPDRIEELAVAFGVAAGDVGPIAADVRRLGTGQLPEIWQGVAGATAAELVTATGGLIEATGPQFTRVRGALDTYAAEVRALRSRHEELHGALRDAWHDATHVAGLPFPDPTALDDLVRGLTRLVTGCIEVYDRSIVAADALAIVLGDVTGKARAGAMADSTLPPAGIVLTTGVGIDGNLTGDNAILAGAQSSRAADRYDQLGPQDRRRFDELLAQAPSQAHRAYLLKALAAGHPLDNVVAFGRTINGREEAWLHRHLSLVNPGQTGSATYDGGRLRQYNDVTCGSMTTIMLRSIADPLYALHLTTGGNPDDPKAVDRDAVLQRLADEQQAIYERSSRNWPDQLGTPPWGLVGELNNHAGTLGTGYEFRLVDDTDAGSVNPALRDAVAAVDAGHTVPVLAGDSYPAHYVLLVGHDGSDLVIYNPGSGVVGRVDENDFRNGNLGSAAGFAHANGVALPG